MNPEGISTNKHEYKVIVKVQLYCYDIVAQV